MTVHELLLRQVCNNLSKKYNCNVGYTLNYFEGDVITMYTHSMLNLVLRVKTHGAENYKEIKSKIEPHIKLIVEGV